jgi:hypothetical protein
MDLASAAHTINATAYSYISSWALLTAAEQRLFDRLPARTSDLVDISPDGDLVDTMLHTLAAAGLVETDGEQWALTDEMTMLLTGEDSYADYLGGQILQQMAPRLTLGRTGQNVLAQVLADPGSRRGYEGWFADADEARSYQSSQYAGSLGPAKAIAASLPDPAGRVLDRSETTHRRDDRSLRGRSHLTGEERWCGRHCCVDGPGAGRSVLG